MKRLVILLLLAFTLALFTACGTGGIGGGGGAAAAGDGAPVTLSVFINHSWYPTESFSGIIPEEITRLTNVILDPTVAIDGGQLGIMIASGDLPDIVYTSGSLSDMSDPLISFSYEYLIDRYNVDWQPTALQLGIARTFSADGQAYTIINHFSAAEDWQGTNLVPMVGSLLYRRDIWESVGSPPMNSFDDLFHVFGLVRDQYPQFSRILALNPNWNILTLRKYWGMGGLEWMEQADGSFIHFTMDPRYRDLIQWLNRAYREGFINPDEGFFVPGALFPADEHFMSAGCTQNHITAWLTDLGNINPNYVGAELVPFAESSFTTSGIGWSGSFITRSNRNPEASINFIAWMFSEEAQRLTQMGRPGIDYTLDDQGFPTFSDEWNASLAAGTHNDVFNPWFYFGACPVVESMSRIANTPPELVEAAYRIQRERFINKPWITAALPLAQTSERITLDRFIELQRSYEARLILSSTPEEFDALWDEFMSSAAAINFNTVEAFMTQNIQNMLPLFQ